LGANPKITSEVFRPFGLHGAVLYFSFAPVERRTGTCHARHCEEKLRDSVNQPYHDS